MNLFANLFGLILVFFLEYVLSFNLQSKLPTVLRPLIDEIDLEHPINFGVTLTALTSSNELNKTILIAGAPAADLGDYNERPGMIFNCDLGDNQNEIKNEFDCKPIKLQNRNRKPIIINDFMQIGSSLASCSSGKFTVCAAGALNLNIKDHYPNGRCWFGDVNSLSNILSNDQKEIPFTNLLSLNPLNDTKRQIYENTYYFSHGMFGFSSKISKVRSCFKSFTNF